MKLKILSIVAANSLVPMVFSGSLCNFKTPGEAEAAGWCPRPKCTLSIGQSASGNSSVMVKAETGAKKYRGLGLFQIFPLQDVKAGDYISFQVKQNFGKGIYINFSTKAGSIYKSLKVPKEKWTSFKLSLDYVQWSRDKKNRSNKWSGGSKLSFYSPKFKQPGAYLEIADLQLVIGGKKFTLPMLKPAITGDIRKAKDSQQYNLLKTRQGIWAIDLETGMTAGVWDRRSGEQCISNMYSKYFIMTPKKEYDITEKTDKAFYYSKTNGVLTVNCRNPQLPGVVIVKKFWIQGPRLYRKLEFLGKETKITNFITIRNEVTFCPEYRKGGYHLGAGYIGPLDPVETISEPYRVTRYKQMTKCMVLSNQTKQVSYSNYRLLINNRLCYPWWQTGISGYSEWPNCLYFTPSGWDMPLGTLKLGMKSKFSVTDVQTLFPGTWYDFLAKVYPETPEVKQDLEKIPAVPEWLSNVYCCMNMSSLQNLRKAVAMSDSGYIMVVLLPSSGWGDYYVDKGMPGRYGGWITGPELKKMIDDIKAIAPDRIKVGIYNLSVSATWKSRIFKKHPEWFRTSDKHGNKKVLFPGLADNWASMIGNKDCYNELLSQYGIQLDYLGVDFIYLDESKTHNIIKWDNLDYTTDADWYSFWKDMQKVVKKRGAEKAIWFNGRGNPYGDVNFMEARNQLRYGFWRKFVGMGLGMETWLKCRPKARLIPLYWHKTVSACYINRVLALGWIPSLTYGDPEMKRPFATASLEMGNSTPVNAVYSPDWKVSPTTLLESYVMKRMNGGDVVMSLISHAKEKKQYTVKIATDSLGLSHVKPLFIRYFKIKTPEQFKGSLTEHEAKALYHTRRLRADLVTEPILPVKCQYNGKNMTVKLELKPTTLYQMVFSNVPGGIYSINNLPANWYFKGRHLLTLTSGSINGKELTITGINQAETAEIMLFTNASKITVNGIRTEVSLSNESGQVLPVIKVPKGKFVIRGTVTAQVGKVENNRVYGGKSPSLAKIKPAPTSKEKFEVKPATQHIDGASIVASGINITRWKNIMGYQKNILPFIARADAGKLSLEAGPSRRIDDFLGFCFAGFEFENLRKIKLQLTNTYYNEESLRGTVYHTHPFKRSKRAFAGFMVDYHTAAGWTKRIAFGVGVMNSKLACVTPRWGRNGKADQLIDLGPIIEKGYQANISLNLAEYAPKGWDGKVWFGVGSDYVASNRRLKVKILAANDKVSGPFSQGLDPRDFKKLFMKKRIIRVPKAPVAPLIDGAADDEMWQAAAQTNSFFLVGGKGIPTENTRIRLFYDDKYLYVGVICSEKERKNLITGTGSIWRDDEIELYFVPDPKNKPVKLYQILINGIGNSLTLLHKQGVAHKINMGLDLKTMKRQNGWHVEVAIPFRSLGVGTPKVGDSWLVNFCRYRPAGKKTKTQEISWSPVMKGFKEYRKFNQIVFTQ